MSKFIKIEDNYYISANSTYADDRTKVLNHGETFGVFDRWGDIQPIGREVQGLYHEGIRYLSAFEFRIAGERPLLLSSAIKENNEILTIDLTNPEVRLKNGDVIPQSKIHAFRNKFLKNGKCYESINVANYDTAPYEFEVTFTLDADFKDIFEIRGMARKKRGSVLPVEVEEGNCLIQSYMGLDEVKRSTLNIFSPVPTEIAPDKVTYRLRLTPKQVFQIQIKTGFQIGEERPTSEETIEEAAKSASAFDVERSKLPFIMSSNEKFNHWLNRSKTDMVSLVAETEHGNYPYAGIPWFNTAFGRDGIITAFEVLWLLPNLARDVLNYLAATQAKEKNDFQDAEPGKILHETRKGEMADLGEIPFKQYYGTIDATPLFVILAGAYYKRTGDLGFVKKIWPNIKAALDWIDNYGDLDGDGFVEYQKRTPNGLINQGWKDADDAVSHETGELAITPVALCEVQGYVYDAKYKAAMLAEALGQPGLSGRLREDAEQLKKKFNAAFWDEELGMFVLALDANKRPCRVKSSNAGQCLFTGIAEPEYAKKVAMAMLSDEMYTGWGIRTLGTSAPRYNPMSYHNGTVWPHDTTLIAYGMAKSGFSKLAMKVFNGLFDAAMFIDMQRLPELFCGFTRRYGEGPTTYPVACSPQAWAVGSVFMLLQACLRLEVDALQKKVIFNKPVMPPWMDSLIIKNLPLGGKRALSLELTRYKQNVGINVLEKDPEWEIVAIK